MWELPPEPLILPCNEVHAWRLSLDCPQKQIDRFLLLLSEDERERAARFYFQADRNHYIAARGSLRAILGRYLGVEPQQLCFEYSAHGKPCLAEQCRKDNLNFNLSHSNGLALLGLTCGREIGIDLEYIRAGFAGDKIAERFFSPQEVSALRALPRNLQDEAFFNCWTRKEAYIKAKGEGLSMPLHLFDVSLAPGEPATLLRACGDEQEQARWRLRELFPGPGFVGAIAVEGHDWELKCWEWQSR